MEGSDVGVPFAFQVSLWTTTAVGGSPFLPQGGGGGITGGGNDYPTHTTTMTASGGMIQHHPSSTSHGVMALGSEMDAAVTAKMQVLLTPTTTNCRI